MSSVGMDEAAAAPGLRTAAEFYTGADDNAVRVPLQELEAAISGREPYFLKTKQGPDARGAVRLHCPAAGPSPSVNCARRDRLRPSTPRGSGPPPTVINLADSRKRAAHPAAKPTVHLPAYEWHTRPSAEELPDVCGKSDIAVPADAGGDRKIAKFRQDNHYLSTSWTATYKPIRSHNEGIHGRLKSSEIDIGNPKHRPAPGQVAQTLLVSIMVTAGNLDILETWLYQRTGTDLTVADYTADAPPTTLASDPPATPGRPPPPAI